MDVKLLNYERSFLFTNSGTAYRPDNTTKNRFTIILSRPISIPPFAKNVMIKCLYASIWNTSPNITINQELHFFRGAIEYVVPISVGLYSLSDMIDTIARFLAEQSLPDDLITLTANYATQRVIFVLKEVNMRIDFTDDNSQLLRVILGFDNRMVGPTTLVFQQESGDEPAAFNQLNSFHVGTSLLNGGGIRINDGEFSTVAIIPVTAAPGSQILFTPINAISLACDNLAGNLVNNVSFWITDEKQRDIVINEPFEISLTVTFLARPQD